MKVLERQNDIINSRLNGICFHFTYVWYHSLHLLLVSNHLSYWAGNVIADAINGSFKHTSLIITNVELVFVDLIIFFWFIAKFNYSHNQL